jgi:hypothetical protein
MCALLKGTILIYFIGFINSLAFGGFKFMFHTRIIGLLLVGMAIVMAYNACAQWSPGGMMVYMGDLNLAGAAGTGGAAPYAIGSVPTSQPSMNNSSMNNSSMSSVAAIGASGLAPLDLSNYGSDRVHGNLAKYKNIMYPIAESRGSTASTAGGAGGGGCGCG